MIPYYFKQHICCPQSTEALTALRGRNPNCLEEETLAALRGEEEFERRDGGKPAIERFSTSSEKESEPASEAGGTGFLPCQLVCVARKGGFCVNQSTTLPLRALFTRSKACAEDYLL